MGWKQLYNEQYNANPNINSFVFSIPVNGSTALVAAGIRGRGATITRTAPGVITIVFAPGNSYLDLLSAVAHMRLAVVANTIAQVGTWVPATRTLTINCVTAGAAAEWPAAGANNVLHVRVDFGDSDTRPNRT